MSQKFMMRFTQNMEWCLFTIELKCRQTPKAGNRHWIDTVRIQTKAQNAGHY